MGGAEAAAEMAAPREPVAGGTDGTLLAEGGVAAAGADDETGLEAELAAGLFIEPAGGAAEAAPGAVEAAAGAAGFAAGAAGAIAGTGTSGAPAGALAGSAMGDADVASANAALVRVSNARLAAAHADAIFHPVLREPPRVFMLHNPFFVA
jgi:hypothetical protein